jgi:hypothetical protein
VLGALCSGIEDAFPDLALEIDELILSPARIWRAIQDAREKVGVPG